MTNQDDSSSEAITNQETNSCQNFSTILKQILDGIPRLACVIVAVVGYFHTWEIERFILLMAFGYTAHWSLPTLKALAPKVATLAKTIAELLDKLK